MRLLITTVLVSLCLPLKAAIVSTPAPETGMEVSLLAVAPIQWALAQIESGHFRNPDTAKGSSGEVSRFQIMPSVWRSYSKSRNYSNPIIAWNVARQILAERESWFVRATGRRPSAFDLYVMWNKPGLYEKVGFNPRRLPQKVREIAGRFENLVHTLR
ncbi:MAG: hypothetical protein HYY23_07160 [Verrucomicrobia bacterium]|nr:hypothetical protein [Verrucomicrobiota bacterium]